MTIFTYNLHASMPIADWNWRHWTKKLRGAKFFNYASTFHLRKMRKSDIRNRRSMSSRYMALKDARIMIPEFDGSSPEKLKKFLKIYVLVRRKKHRSRRRRIISSSNSVHKTRRKSHAGFRNARYSNLRGTQTVIRNTTSAIKHDRVLQIYK